MAAKLGLKKSPEIAESLYLNLISEPYSGKISFGKFQKSWRPRLNRRRIRELYHNLCGER
ncbi:hypothetical protein C4J81_16835 [Deltaproteobacteria bacterium Smac51]|nr:hypothetical protein C4J81_16835 [Deltaproteobacteria bacterium Smac51]